MSPGNRAFPAKVATVLRFGNATKNNAQSRAGTSPRNRSTQRPIVAEGYRLAEYMLRDYEDRPSVSATIGRWVERLRGLVPARD